MSPSQITLTKQQAKKFLTKYHFLNPARQLTHDEILPVLFQRFGCIQFDTINVVGRNADLVLQSRVKDYRPEILDDLLYHQRSLIDGWDKLASIYPTEDWPYFDRHRNAVRERHRVNAPDVYERKPKIIEMIREVGEISSLHFNSEERTDWAWGPTSISRATLESLYAEGVLGIHHRVNTRRHFDLIERLVSEEILNRPDPNPSLDEYLEWHILRRIGSIGIASTRAGDHWLGIFEGRKVAHRKPIIDRLAEEEIVTHVLIEGVDDQTLYMRSEHLPLLNSFIDSPDDVQTASFLAPLDNFTWNRRFLEELYDFSYTWEVYKPQDQREYGYYVLPVLYGDAFIARVDMKFLSKTGQLNLVNWWWEEDVQQTPEMHQAIYECFRDFMNYLNAKSLSPDPDTVPAEFVRQCLQDLV